jgi:hypothetical protein
MRTCYLVYHLKSKKKKKKIKINNDKQEQNLQQFQLKSQMRCKYILSKKSFIFYNSYVSVDKMKFFIEIRYAIK